MSSSHPGPLFETSLSRVLAAVSHGIAAVLTQLLDSPAPPPAELRRQVGAYVESLEAAARTEEFLDLETARQVASQCLALLERAEAESAERQRLIQLAVQYFLLDEDAEGDTASPIGFDDDAEVVDTIARELGRVDALRR